jgi:hypothetical protein
MKHALIAALLVVSTPAFASTDDDYVSCLVGRSAVALLNDEASNAETAQKIAYEACPQPPLPDDIDLDGLQDMVNIMVERMATE